jgi:hypothetical protein
VKNVVINSRRKNVEIVQCFARETNTYKALKFKSNIIIFRNFVCVNASSMDFEAAQHQGDHARLKHVKTYRLALTPAVLR